MSYAHLITLASTYASHVKRAEATVAGWAGLHKRLYRRLRDGQGCRHDTYLHALDWFTTNWPSDLAWPSDVPRPARRPLATEVRP